MIFSFLVFSNVEEILLLQKMAARYPPRFYKTERRRSISLVLFLIFSRKKSLRFFLPNLKFEHPTQVVIIDFGTGFLYFFFMTRQIIGNEGLDSYYRKSSYGWCSVSRV